MNLIIRHITRLNSTIRRHWRMIALKLQFGAQFQAEKFHFRKGFSVFIEEDGILSIGKGCFFNNNCSITARKKVSIGRNCIFGENVKIYDHNHCYKDNNKLICKQGFSSAEVVIEEDCRIASNVVILKGVHIGKHSVIGAGVVVYKDVPAGSVLVCKQEVVNLH